MLLPSMLRKPVISAFLQAMVSQLEYVKFNEYRQRTNYRLNHNGQICYLRAVLNDMYDPSPPDLPGRPRITIGDGIPPKIVVVHGRVKRQLVGIPPRSNDNPLIIGWRGTAVGGGYDFTVKVPPEIYADSNLITRITATVNEYKLASKKFQIVSI
jgi:hypothetical protein